MKSRLVHALTKGNTLRKDEIDDCLLMLDDLSRLKRYKSPAVSEENRKTARAIRLPVGNCTSHIHPD